jgi:hypothetical protein
MQRLAAEVLRQLLVCDNTSGIMILRARAHPVGLLRKLHFSAEFDLADVDGDE